MNFYSLLTASLASLLIGFVWYNPKVFGTIWIRESGIKFDPDNKPNRLKMLLIHFICAFFMAVILQFLVIHQTAVVSLIGGDAKKGLPSFTAFMADYGTNFRTFKHGALHGTLTGLFFVMPLFGITALYEGRGFKYVLVAAGYWVISLAVMGGIICAWM